MDQNEPILESLWTPYSRCTAGDPDLVAEFVKETPDLFDMLAGGDFAKVLVIADRVRVEDHSTV